MVKFQALEVQEGRKGGTGVRFTALGKVRVPVV